MLRKHRRMKPDSGYFPRHTEQELKLQSLSVNDSRHSLRFQLNTDCACFPIKSNLQLLGIPTATILLSLAKSRPPPGLKLSPPTPTKSSECDLPQFVACCSLAVWPPCVEARLFLESVLKHPRQKKYINASGITKADNKDKFSKNFHL